jgi:hypothetical protein
MNNKIEIEIAPASSLNYNRCVILQFRVEKEQQPGGPFTTAMPGNNGNTFRWTMAISEHGEWSAHDVSEDPNGAF